MTERPDPGQTGRRLIEEDFPLQEVSAAAVREKTVRHGHIATLHIWWARRPLAASRAATLAALLPAPADPDERRRLLALVRDIAPWEAVKNGDSPMIQQARDLLRQAYGGRAPRVLDCFAGGGAIPLEALRLGCETCALDYNPVAVLILTCVLVYPQRFGRPEKRLERTPQGLMVERVVSPLVEAVKRWGTWVLEAARQDLAPFYPRDPDGSVPVGYLWARTLPCQNPACGAKIPLLRQTWLARKEDRPIALRLVPDRAARRVAFVIVGQNGEPLDFDPDEGTVARATVRCPLCGGVIDDDTTRRLFREGQAGERLVAVVLHRPGEAGKRYRLAADRDQEAYRAAAERLVEKRLALWGEWGMDPVPDEPLPPEDTLGFRVQRYGLSRWGDLFNARQKLALITFAAKVREAHQAMLAEGADPEFAKAVTTYLGLTLSHLSDRCSVLCRLISQTEAVGFTFSRQALPMLWDYYELEPMANPGGWTAVLEDTLAVLAHCLRNYSGQKENAAH